MDDVMFLVSAMAFKTSCQLIIVDKSQTGYIWHFYLLILRDDVQWLKHFSLLSILALLFYLRIAELLLRNGFVAYPSFQCNNNVWYKDAVLQLAVYSGAAVCPVVTKGSLPSCTIALLFMWHIGLWFVTVNGYIFYHDNKPPFVVAAAFSARLLYRRPLSPHSAEGLTPSFPFYPLTIPCYQRHTSNTVTYPVAQLEWV